MKTLRTKLENCYGIKSLSHTFSFTKSKGAVVYAPNGTMKTSFAKTFNDYSKGKQPSDEYFPERKSTFQAVDEDGKPLNREQIYVFNSLDSHLSSDRISTLLVNKDLKTRYDELIKILAKNKADVLKSLKALSHMSKNIEEEICDAFKENSIFDCLLNNLQKIEDETAPIIENAAYKTIYNPKVAEFLQNKENAKNINDYIKKYEELLEQSTFFKKGGFNHTNAADISKQLGANKYFEANHKLLLNGENEPINSKKKLDELFKQELTRIINDNTLQKKFESLDKSIQNIDLKNFREYLESHQEIMPFLSDTSTYRQMIWISYFKQIKGEATLLVKTYQSVRDEIAEISEEAKKQETQWEGVIRKFNRRFIVPYEILIENKEDVILNDNLPNLRFLYMDREGESEEKSEKMDRGSLIRNLSTGEQKALFILENMYEIENLKASGLESLLIIDDLADSFDYKNKYAIVQYISDIIMEANFKAIILTHNYDFFRTITNRLQLEKNSYLAFKDRRAIVLDKNKSFTNFFEDWKENYQEDISKAIALIPLVRNLIEYTKGISDNDYLLLTNALHYSKEIETLTFRRLVELYNKLFNKEEIPEYLDRSVLQEIQKVAKGCCSQVDEVCIKSKLVLSIAIRINAEKYMTGLLLPEYQEELTNLFTIGQLYGKFIQHFSEDFNRPLLEEVLLMTPANIHFNSFMFEPLIDMSILSLQDLYKRSREL